MTAECSGGPSAPKPGAPTTFYVTGGAVALLLSRLNHQWAAELAGFIGGISFTMPDFCNTDPAPAPTITATTVADLMGINGTLAQIAAVAVFKDLIARYLWWDICECTTVTTPATPAPIAAPAGSPVANPPAVIQNQSVLPCYEVDGNTVTDNGLSGGMLCCPYPGPPPQILANQLYSQGGQAYTAYKYTIKNNADGTHNGSIQVRIAFVDSGGTIIRQDTGPVIPSGGSGSGSGVTPAAWYHVTAWVDSLVNPQNNTYTSHFEWYCGNQPLQPAGPCCPPDPLLQQEVDQILALVTQLQRRNLPFAYQNGATHAGVTGSGELAVSQLLGVKLSPGAIPQWAGVTAGDPDELWLESWITWGNADGWTERQWLRHSPQISIPANCQLYTKLGYSFAPGLSVDIQELEAEA